MLKCLFIKTAGSRFALLSQAHWKNVGYSKISFYCAVLKFWGFFVIKLFLYLTFLTKFI